MGMTEFVKEFPARPSEKPNDTRLLLPAFGNLLRRGGECLG